MKYIKELKEGDKISDIYLCKYCLLYTSDAADDV